MGKKLSESIVKKRFEGGCAIFISVHDEILDGHGLQLRHDVYRVLCTTRIGFTRARIIDDVALYGGHTHASSQHVYSITFTEIHMHHIECGE